MEYNFVRKKAFRLPNKILIVLAGGVNGLQ